MPRSFLNQSSIIFPFWLLTAGPFHLSVESHPLNTPCLDVFRAPGVNSCQFPTSTIAFCRVLKIWTREGIAEIRWSRPADSSRQCPTSAAEANWSGSVSIGVFKGSSQIWRFIMLYYGLLWFFVVYCGLLRFIVVYYGLLWFITVYYGLLWSIMVYYGLLWSILVFWLTRAIWDKLRFIGGNHVLVFMIFMGRCHRKCTWSKVALHTGWWLGHPSEK